MTSTEGKAVDKSIKDLLKQFHDYDDALTCVASWCYLLTIRSEYKPFTLHFEWFPSIDHNGTLKTPDFTALHKKGGIIGEVKANMPQDDALFDKELQQIASYDELHHLPSMDGSLTSVDNIDIALLVRDTCADEVTQRILDRYNDEGHIFSPKKMPIVMAYSFTQDSGDTRFVLRRTQLHGNGEFSRMLTNPPGKDLYYMLCERKVTVRLPPQLWVHIKSKYMVMNDAPPSIFCAVFTWQYLTQYAVSVGANEHDIKRGKSIDLPISATQISKDIKDNVFFNQTLQVGWIRSGLEFLRRAGLATRNKSDLDLYTIKLQPFLGGRSSHADDVDEYHDLAKELAERYIKATTIKPKSSKSGSGKTSDLTLSLFDI